LRLVVRAVETDAARKVEERLLLRKRTQHRDRRLQRRELAIGVEDVELGVVLAESAPFRMVRDTVVVLVVTVDQYLNDFPQRGLVVGEVGLHGDRAVLERHDGDQIRRCHLRIDVLQRVRIRTDLIGRRHSRAIEVEDEQPPVLVTDVAGRRRRYLRHRRLLHLIVGGRWRRNRSGLRVRVCSRGAGWRRALHALKLNEGDVLRLAVLGHGEIFRRQPFDDLAILILDRHCLDDETSRGAKDRLLSLLLLCVRDSTDHDTQRHRGTENPKVLCRRQGAHLKTSFSGSSARVASG
jgi:hypothetical protein